MEKYFRLNLCTSAVVLILATASLGANAATLTSDATSISGMATAYAGSATGFHDHTDLFFNPAILTLSDKTQLTLGMAQVDPKISAHFNSTSIAGVAQPGVADASPGRKTMVGNIYFSTRINPDWAFGMALTSPYDLSTQYDANSLARFHALTTRIKSQEIEAALAYRVTPNTSVGFGVRRQTVEADVSRNIGLAPTPGFATQPAGLFSGKDSQYGYSLGLLTQVTPKLKVGAGYRSEMKQILAGPVYLNTFYGYEGNVHFTLPEMFNIGAAYQINDKLEVATDLRWDRWSRISKFLIERVNPPPGHTNLVVALPFRDTLMASLGVNYQLNGQWLLRGGVALEKDAVGGADFRNPRFPFANATWLTFGAQYKVSDNMRLNLTYAHQFIHDADSNIAYDPVNRTAALDGRYTNQATRSFGASLQVSW